MGDYNLAIKVRNGRIYGRMREMGIKNIAELARRSGIAIGQIADVANLKLTPLKANGDWRSTVLAIAGVLKCDPDDLFTQRQKVAAVETNSLEVSMGEPEFARLCGIGENVTEKLSDKLLAGQLLECLPARDRRIVESRMSGDTLVMIGEKERASPERVRQIEMKALRKMRTHARAQGWVH